MHPLAGLRIVVTRAAAQGGELAQALREAGADVILLPMIEIAPPSDPEPLRQAASKANQYDWIIFTSANAVQSFAAELPKETRISNPQIATVGAATRHAAEQQGFAVSLTPAEYVAEALIESFRDHDLQGSRILIPSSAIARDTVATQLRARGALVDLVEAYRNILPPEAAKRAREIFQEPYPAWVIFASSSAVRNLAVLAGPAALRKVKIASIGPVTSETVRDYGLEVAAEASSQT